MKLIIEVSLCHALDGLTYGFMMNAILTAKAFQMLVINTNVQKESITIHQNQKLIWLGNTIFKFRI